MGPVILNSQKSLVLQNMRDRVHVQGCYFTYTTLPANLLKVRLFSQGICFTILTYGLVNHLEVDINNSSN